MNKRKLFSVFILSIILFYVTAFFYSSDFFTKLDYIAYDNAVKLIRLKKPISDEIALLLIDETSLETLNPIVGRWPWRRAIYSDLLDFLSIGKPRAVLFDILFTENQKDTDSKEISIDDMLLVNATKEAGFVYHAMQLRMDDEDEFNKNLLNRPISDDFIEKFSLKEIKVNDYHKQKYNNYYIPFDELYRATYGMAIVEFSPDSDGVFRRTIPIREYAGNFLPVMGIAPFVDKSAVEINRKWIKVGNRRIPVDKSGDYILNFYGEFNTFSISGILASLQKIRRGDVENLIINPMEFKDKIVFIGASAVGVEDLKPTPIAPRTPGVFLHATLASNFLLDDFLIPPNPLITLCAIFLVTFLCITGIIYSKKFVLKILFPLFVLSIWVLFVLIQFKYNFLNELVPPLAAILLSSMVSFGYLLITEGKEKFRVKRLFSQYVSPDVLSEVLKNNDFASPNIGRKEDITVLFTDIRDFTSFSDRTPPEKVVEMLNFFFSRMAKIIFCNKGSIDKFIGDAIMAFWGAPLKIEDHPEKAVIAAIDMIGELRLIKQALWERGFDLDLKIGIGINSGDAILGNIGSENKLNYTIVGDTVNVASRLQELTKFYECPIVISEITYKRLKKSIPCRVIDIINVRGKEKTIKIYEPLCFKDMKDIKNKKELFDITNAAFDLYQKRDFKKALQMYYMIDDGRLKDIFINRCKKKLKA